MSKLSLKNFLNLVDKENYNINRGVHCTLGETFKNLLDFGHHFGIDVLGTFLSGVLHMGIQSVCF